ncbi:MAG: hypothetical protein CME55_05080 [Halieaceae bacterium]|nr:hypothetical protein [Halieaceae bacterium]
MSDTASARLSEAGFFCAIFSEDEHSSVKSVLMRAFVLVLLVAGVQVSAETPLPFGIRVQDIESLEQHHSNVVFDTDLLAAAYAAEQALGEMERRLGPYHPDLAPALVETANLSLAIGNIEAAEQYLDQALHNARVNNGLYGDQQLPILRGLLDLFLLSGDREGFEERAAYQLRLLGAGLPPFEAGELQAATEFFDVSLDALLDASWEGKARAVLRLHDRFESMTEQVCADPSVADTWCQPLTFRLGRFYYLLEYKLDVLVDDPRLERGFTDPSWQSLDREPRLEALQRRLFIRGELMFERLLSLKPDDHDALSALADWHWFYKKRDQATKLYRRACAAEPQRFESAGPLPEYPRLAYKVAFRDVPVSVELSTTVTERGQPRDLDLAALEPEAEGVPGSLKRALRNMVFRPAFANCQDPAESMLEMKLFYLP